MKILGSFPGSQLESGEFNVLSQEEKEWEVARLGLGIVAETKDLIQYEPFILNNPQKLIRYKNRHIELPEHDGFYYRSVKAQIEHLVFKYNHGWIKSFRQLILDTNDCMSTFHIVPNASNGKLEQVNIYCRSTNIAQMEYDVEFSVWIVKYLKEVFGNEPELNITFSIPHIIKK